MNKTALIGAALVAAFASSPTIAKPIPFNGEPVANAPLPRIGNYTTPNNKQLYVEASRDNWYRANLANTCPGLKRANQLQIKMADGANLNSSSTVMVNGNSCQVASVARVQGPIGRNKVLRFQAGF